MRWTESLIPAMQSNLRRSDQLSDLKPVIEVQPPRAKNIIEGVPSTFLIKQGVLVLSQQGQKQMIVEHSWEREAEVRASSTPGLPRKTIPSPILWPWVDSSVWGPLRPSCLTSVIQARPLVM